MNLVLDELISFIGMVNKYANSVDSSISNRKNDFRSMCFWNIHNRAILTKEIVTMYQNTQNNSGIGIQPEITERIITVTKDMFVDTVSSIEKATKDCVDVYKTSKLKEKSLEGSAYLYLRNIISASMKLGYISEQVFDLWESILTIRNLTAHNNSVSDRSKIFEVEGIHIYMRPNRMMRGPPNTFVVLTSKVTELFYDWLTDIDKMFR